MIKMVKISINDNKNNNFKKKKKVTKIILIFAFFCSLTTLVYVYRDFIQTQIDIHFYLRNLRSFDEIDVFFSEQDTIVIDNNEYDYRQLKEDYGALSYFVIPMSNEEIDAKFNMITEYNKRLQAFYSRNNLYGDMYGFLIELPFEVEDRMMVHFTSYVDKLMSLQAPVPNQDFLRYVSKRVSCVDPIPEQQRPRACFLNSDIDYGNYLDGQIKLKDLTYENKEFEVKKTLFYFRLYYDFLTIEGYDLNQYKINQDFITKEVEN